MHRHGWILVTVAAGALAAAGCWYERPNLEEQFALVEIGMAKDEVVEQLGEPTYTLGDSVLADPQDPKSEERIDELFYIYDDPDNPVRFRIVLNERDVVVRKFYETKAELAKKAEEVKGEVPPIQLVPGEDERAYPGGPLKRFEEQTKERRL
jgi:hypothetical protein